MTERIVRIRNIEEFTAWADRNRSVYGYALANDNRIWKLERNSGRDGRKVVTLPDEVGEALARGWRPCPDGGFSGHKMPGIMLNMLLADETVGPKVMQALAKDDLGKVYREVYQRTKTVAAV